MMTFNLRKVELMPLEQRKLTFDSHGMAMELESSGEMIHFQLESKHDGGSSGTHLRTVSCDSAGKTNEASGADSDVHVLHVLLLQVSRSIRPSSSFQLWLL